MQLGKYISSEPESIVTIITQSRHTAYTLKSIGADPGEIPEQVRGPEIQAAVLGGVGTTHGLVFLGPGAQVAQGAGDPVGRAGERGDDAGDERRVDPRRIVEAAAEAEPRVEESRQAHRQGEAGRGAALELSWERNARLTLGVYERVLAAAP